MKRPGPLLLVVWCLVAASAHAGEELVKFDYQQAELRLVNDRWYLCCGKLGLKDLGPNETSALEVLRLVRDLRLTQRGSIGKPLPIIEYWLSDGKAPHGIMTNLRLLAFNPAKLRVEQVQGQWCVQDGPQVLFGFGAQVEAARKTVAVLQEHGFNRVGYVGTPTPVMMYFLASDEPPPVVRPMKTETPVPAQTPPLAMVLPSYQLSVTNQTPEEQQRSADRFCFDWFRTEVRCENTHWKLMVGDRCLADFGANQEQAREALHIVQFYRFTEQCRAGGSASACTYYLVNGEAPRGLMLELTREEFQADALALRQDGDVWKLCERGRSLLAVGNTQEEASAALRMIQRYQFTHVCYLGSPQQPALSILVRDR